MPTLPPNPKLTDYQQYVRELEVERGFQNQTVLQRCLQLGEEVGELFQAIRKKENMKTDHQTKIGSVDEELADIFIFLCSIANRYGIDFEKAFREKEEINKKRTWR